MKRNNLIIILGGVLAVLVLVFASLHTATVWAAHHNADRLSVQSITIPSRLTSAPTADSDEAPCYPGTDAVDPPLYPARAFLPLVVAQPSPPTCANEVEPNDTYSSGASRDGGLCDGAGGCQRRGGQRRGRLVRAAAVLASDRDAQDDGGADGHARPRSVAARQSTRCAHHFLSGVGAGQIYCGAADRGPVLRAGAARRRLRRL